MKAQAIIKQNTDDAANTTSLNIFNR